MSRFTTRLLCLTPLLAGCGEAEPCLGAFEVAHAAPIHQDITRAAFLVRAPDREDRIVFSTLEANGSGDRGFLLAAHAPGTQRTTIETVSGSAEGRSFAYAESLGIYVLGTSLVPQLLTYDPATDAVRMVFRGPKHTAWIHRLAVRGDEAVTVLSTSTDGVPGFKGILRVNVRTGRSRVVPFPAGEASGYGGVETVDPAGRVWLYRAYPYRRLWYDSANGFRDRRLAGFEDWSVESWDRWRGADYVLLSNRRGELVKRHVDLKTLRVVADLPSAGADEDTERFLELVPVDLFHTAGPALASLYYHPSTAGFYLRDAPRDTWTRAGRAELGRMELATFHDSPQESGLRWQHPALGELEVLGVAAGELVIWLRGRKTYGTVALETGRLRLRDIPVANLSPADITALEGGRDGAIYGGGGLTMSHLFRFNPKTGSSTLLNEAVPNAEGQVNALWTGPDGMLYGAGYPDAVPFRFDPGQPWSPGGEPGSNPLNLGPLGHGGQSRVHRGIQDPEGLVWFQSVSDYTASVTHALARVDFARRRVDVRTDMEPGFPRVDQLALLDAAHLVLLGAENERPGLFTLDRRTMQITRKQLLSQAGGVLANGNPLDATARPWLVQGRRLYRVGGDLSLTLVHLAPGPITNVLMADSGAVLMVGPRHVEHMRADGRTTMWWRSGSATGDPIFQNRSWTPATILGGVLYVGDGARLLRLRRPEACRSTKEAAWASR